MKRISFTVLFWLLFFSALNFAQPTNWQALASRIPGGLEPRRLGHLQQQWQVEEVEPNILKMTHKATGMVKYVDITDHQIDFSKLSPNVQVIDLINADTTLYNQKYTRQPEILLVGGGLGYPMIIEDLNNNGMLDFAAVYKIPINPEIAHAGIVELDSDSTFQLKKVYQDTVIIPLAVTDVNSNGLLELNITDPLLTTGGKAFVNYEQSNADSFPNVRRFAHQTWEFGSQVASETFTKLDNDIYTDVLYVGTDSTQQCCHQVIVAEYDTSSHDFQRRFSMIPSPDWRISGFSVEDFDGDGFLEFVTGSGASYSHIYIWENTGDDSYTQVYVDTMTTANAYMTTASNDIDGNGKIEFFVGGSSFYNGVPASRIYWFEANGNNQYTKVRNIFMLGTDVLGTTELYSYDVNNDSVDDLVFAFSFSVVMLIWNGATQEFDLCYYDLWENYDQEIQSINMYDFSNTDNLDLFISVTDIANSPYIKSFFYRFNPITSIEIPPVQLEGFHLAQNYPNPFNSNTYISFYLPKRENISLTIYDLTGKEVIRLINPQMHASGEHEIAWNGINQTGKEVSSGIYLYELRAEGFKQVRKMLFIK